MIISTSRRFIFVHVMKTAGTSVTAALDPFLRWNDVVVGGTRFGEQVQPAFRERFGLSKHSTAAEIRAVVGTDVWSASFTFTFVRHPYARAVSFYTWLAEALRRNPDPAAPARSWTSAHAFAESRNFSEFIRHEKFLETRAARPQVESVCDEEGRCLVEFVGRVEELDAGMRTVFDRLGLPARPLERHNRSPDSGPPAPVACAEADYDHLHRLFRPDFDRFGYDPALRFPTPA